MVLLEWFNERDIAVVIPLKAHYREQRICDWLKYMARHVIERMFKYFRRIATLFEKKVSHFKEIPVFSAVLLWLR